MAPIHDDRHVGLALEGFTQFAFQVGVGTPDDDGHVPAIFHPACRRHEDGDEKGRQRMRLVQGERRPWRIAKSTAWRRRVTLSLRKILFRWVFTVSYLP
jgi:hypothetical protein